MGTHQDYHMSHPFLSYNLSFPSLTPVTSLVMPTNNGPILRNFILEILKPCCWMLWGIISLTVWLTLTVIYKSLFPDIDNCCTLVLKGIIGYLDYSLEMEIFEYCQANRIFVCYFKASHLCTLAVC